jgi:alpha-aminoadipate/glutamate carrier protein LysW
MAPEIVICPVCKQKLMIQDYVTVGSEMVCNNCESALRIDSRRPLRVTLVPYTATLDPDSRPESYG